jgi:hypothetical protein
MGDQSDECQLMTKTRGKVLDRGLDLTRKQGADTDPVGCGDFREPTFGDRLPSGLFPSKPLHLPDLARANNLYHPSLSKKETEISEICTRVLDHGSGSVTHVCCLATEE